MRCEIEYEETKSGNILFRTASGQYVEASQITNQDILKCLGILCESEKAGTAETTECGERCRTPLRMEWEKSAIQNRRDADKKRAELDMEAGIRCLFGDLSYRERRDFYEPMSFQWVRETFVNTRSSRHGFGVALTRICRRYGFAYIEKSSRSYHRSAFEKLETLYKAKDPFVQHLRAFEKKDGAQKPSCELPI